MPRRPLAWAAVLVLLGEALGLIAVNAVLTTFVDEQNMSLAGLDPAGITLGAWVTSGLAALFLLACALILLAPAVKDRAPGRAGRITLIVCAVAHGATAALTLGLVGWTAFAFLTVVLGLLVLVLLAYGPDRAGAGSQDRRRPVRPTNRSGRRRVRRAGGAAAAAKGR